MATERFPSQFGPGFDSGEGLVMALLEELRSVRAHIDMRTQTHTTLQLSNLLAAAALVGGFFGLKEEVSEATDLLLLVPIVFFIIAGQYLEVSYQVYIAESYLNSVLRPQLLRVLEEVNLSRSTQLTIEREILQFEWYAEKSRGTLAGRLVGLSKGALNAALPVPVFLILFVSQKDPCEWGFFHVLGFTVDSLVYVGLLPLALYIHSRPGLPKLRERV